MDDIPLFKTILLFQYILGIFSAGVAGNFLAVLFLIQIHIRYIFAALLLVGVVDICNYSSSTLVCFGLGRLCMVVVGVFVNSSWFLLNATHWFWWLGYN